MTGKPTRPPSARVPQVAPTLAVPPPAAPTIAAPPPTPGAPARTDPTALGTPGRRIGRYEVVRELGRGGMGVVLVVRDPVLDRRLALKLILGDADADAVARFGREAQVMARVRHRNVVGVHELGRAPEGPFIVSDLVEGRCLRDALGTPLEPREAARIVRDLADGLAACHAAGIVHRDLKPHNVILKPDGTPVVLDFGIARDEAAERLTRTGQLVGTPNYMAPEQADGSHPSTLDARLDVYGLGAILFECLAARPPFHDTTSAMSILKRVMLDDPLWPRATNRAVPAELEAVLEVAMAKDKAARHPTAADLRDDLERWLKGERPWAADRVPTPRRPRWKRVVGLLGALVFAAAIVGALRALYSRGIEAEAAAQALDEIRKAELDPEQRRERADTWRDHHPGSPLLSTIDAQLDADVQRVRHARKGLDEILGDARLDAEGRRSALEAWRTKDHTLDWLAAHHCDEVVERALGLEREARASLPAAVLTLPTSMQGRVKVAVLPDGRRAAVGTPGGVALLDLDRLGTLLDGPHSQAQLDEVVRPRPGISNAVGLTVTPDGRVVVAEGRQSRTSGDPDPVCVIHVLGPQADPAPFEIQSIEVHAIAATKELLAVAGSKGGLGAIVVVQLAQPHDGGLNPPTQDEEARAFRGVCFSRERLLALTEGRSGPRAFLSCYERLGQGWGWRAVMSEELGGPGSCMGVTADGSTLVVGTGDGGLERFQLVEAGLGARTGRFTGSPGTVLGDATGPPRAHSGDVTGVAFVSSLVLVSVSAGQGHLPGVTRGPDGRGRPEIRAWGLDDTHEVLLDALEGHGEPRVRHREDPLVSAAVAPGLLLVGTDAGTLEVWRLSSFPR